MTTTSKSSTGGATTGEFDVEAFEQKLLTLKDTQDGIQQMSAWCLQQRAFHKKIVSSWLNVLKQVRVEHRLTLFYLANDVIQYSKRKNYEFVESWGTALQKATTMVRDEKVKGKIFRIFKIWEQREIYSEEYLSDLNGLLSMNPVKKAQQSTAESSDDFQNSILISNIRDCVKLGKATDKNFKNLPKVPNCDIETIKNNLKDRSHSDDTEKDIDEFVNALEAYLRSLKTEIRSRKSLINHITQADTFYTNLRGEVKVVVNAYKNFGNRIKLVKKKLDEITPNLPSPIPSPDINAPSPEPDADIILPDDQSNISINMFKNSSNGYTSYMDGNLPFDINDFKRESPKKQPIYETSNSGTQHIQVINNRSEQNSDSSYDFYKPSDDSYTPMDTPLPVPPASNYGAVSGPGSYVPPSNSIIGVGGGYTNNAVPPPSNYHNDAYNESTYAPATSTNTSSYDTQMPLMPPPMPPLLGVSDDFNSTWDMDMSWTSINSNNSFNTTIDTPVSPPHFEREGVNPDLVEYMDGNMNDEIVPLQDVDHRQLHLPPSSLMKDKGRSIDVDHRNLISLTGSPGPRSFENNNKKNSPPSVAANQFQKQQSEPSDIDYRRQTSSGGDMDYRTQNFHQQKHHQGRMQTKEAKSTNTQDILKEIRTTVALQQTPTVSKEGAAKSNSSVNESPRKHNSEKSSHSINSTSNPFSSDTLHPPPSSPSLDASIFPAYKTFLSSPPAFNSFVLIPGKTCRIGEENGSSVTESMSALAEDAGAEETEAGTITMAAPKKGMGNDNVESIDMDMSDEDADHNKDNSQKLNTATISTVPVTTNDDNASFTPEQVVQPVSRPPLLETPLDIQPWGIPGGQMMDDLSGEDDINNDMLGSQMMWNHSRMPQHETAAAGGFHMPSTTIPQFMPRSSFMQSQRGGGGGGFNHSRPRNSPYFNNNRNGGKRYGGNRRNMPQRSHRGGFRGPKNWQ